MTGFFISLTNCAMLWLILLNLMTLSAIRKINTNSIKSSTHIVYAVCFKCIHYIQKVLSMLFSSKEYMMHTCIMFQLNNYMYMVNQCHIDKTHWQSLGSRVSANAASPITPFDVFSLYINFSIKSSKTVLMSHIKNSRIRPWNFR